MSEEIIIFGKDGCKGYSSKKLFQKVLNIRRELNKKKEVLE